MSMPTHLCPELRWQGSLRRSNLCCEQAPPAILAVRSGPAFPDVGNPGSVREKTEAGRANSLLLSAPTKGTLSLAGGETTSHPWSGCRCAIDRFAYVVGDADA